MFAFLNRIRGNRSAEGLAGNSRPSLRKAARPRRLELENLEQRLVLFGGIHPTSYTQFLTDPIAAEYNATAYETDLNGHIVQQVLRAATSAEIDVPGVPGARMETFQNGAIYWSPDTSANVVLGAIYGEYLSLGGPAGYGLPTSDEASVPGVPGARFNSFQNGGDIYYSSNSGAHEVHGAINAYYQSVGGPTSYLGLPTSDEQGAAGPRFNYFQNGKIVWTPQDGAYAVQAVTQMTFDAGIGFSDGTPVGGSAHLTVYMDGSYHFTGNLHDSGFPSYNDNVVVGLRSPSGQAIFFVHSGHMAGTIESGSRDDNWDVSGTNTGLAQNWADFEGAKSTFVASVNADWNPLINQVEQVGGVVLGVIGIIVAA